MKNSGKCDSDNAVFEVKIAEKIRQMSEFGYDLSEIKFSVSANVFPSIEETQSREYDFDAELTQTKLHRYAALLIFKHND